MVFSQSDAGSWAAVGMSAVALIGTIIANIVSLRKSANDAANAVKIKEIESTYNLEMQRLKMQLEFAQKELLAKTQELERAEQRIETLEGRGK